jgi:acyl-CoA synthetase (AMP-forming)/AMP-acid ligase II
MSTGIGIVNDADTQSVSYSLFHGPTDTPLIDQTLATFLDTQCVEFGHREVIVTPWNGTRWTYNHLRLHSTYLARYLLSEGIKPGDRVGILAGNRVEYASVLFACMRLGAILVILNNTYTKQEVEYALSYTGGCIFLRSGLSIDKEAHTRRMQGTFHHYADRTNRQHGNGADLWSWIRETPTSAASPSTFWKA